MSNSDNWGIVDLCPTCGQPLPMRDVRSPRVERAYRLPGIEPHVMGIVAAGGVPEAWQSMETHSPARAASREADVYVPALQSAITALVAAIVAGILTVVASAMRGWPWWTVPAAMTGAGVAVFGWQWARLLEQSRALLVRTQRWERPEAGLQPARSDVDRLRVEMHTVEEGVKRWTIDELPVSRVQLASIARSVEEGVHRWSRRDIASYPGIGEERAKALLTTLEQYGYLAYPEGRNHPEGARVTAKGRALFRAL
jgi:hypothetical protein